MAAFLTCAMVLGGGGSPSPKAEILVQLSFVLAIIAWLWWAPRGDIGAHPIPRPLLWFGLTLVFVPLAQLVPLPPAIWHELPGRQLEIATLSLVGEENGWRALTISPPRTLAGLLALIPAVGVMWATAVLSSRDRQFVILTIAVLALIGTLLGALQLAGGPGAFQLYEKSHRGWLTAFHANRNAAADVLLVGSLALSAWLASKSMPVAIARHRTPMLVAAQCVLLIALILTGSRAGIVLVLPVLVIHWAMLKPTGLDLRGRVLLGGVASVLLLLLAVPYLLEGNMRLAGVAERFDATGDARIPLWADSWSAIEGFGIAGSGIGTFSNAFMPFESIEYLDAASPNRAHNDYLEFLLEAGLFAPLVLAGGVAVLICLARQAWRIAPHEHATQLFAIGTLVVIALHSIVDYPLRNMAIASIVGVAAGILAVARRRSEGREERDIEQ